MARRTPKRGPLDYGKSPWLILFGFVTFIVLYAPIAQLIAFSFND
jgi:ABC-type spermidine/putrescine transport system permease subunit II